MHNFPRPQEKRLFVARDEAEGRCAECGTEGLKAYRVLSEGGWWTVVKCQSCLASLSRVPAPHLGSIQPLGSAL